MTVKNTTVFSGFSNVVAGVPLSIDRPITSADDISVFYVNTAGQTVEATVGTHYSVVVPLEFTSFTVTPTTALVTQMSSAKKLFVYRLVDITQAIDLTTDDNAVRRNLTKMVDRLTMISQQLAEGLMRSVRLPFGAVQPDLPAADVGKFLVLSDTGVRGASGADLLTGISAGVTAILDSRIDDALDGALPPAVEAEVAATLTDLVEGAVPPAVAAVLPYDPVSLIHRDWTFKFGDFELVGNSGDFTDGNALQNHFIDYKNRRIYGWAETGSSRRICRWNLDDASYTRLPLDSAALSTLTGHSGGGIEYVGGGTAVKIWAGGQNSYTDGAGNAWTRSDYVAGQPPQNVQTFKLFPAGYGVSAGCIDFEEQTLVAYAFKTGGADGLLRTFNLAALVAAGPGDRSVGYHATEFPLTYFVGFPKQGFAAKDGRIFIASGELTLRGAKTMTVLDYAGNFIAENTNWCPGRFEAAAENYDDEWENEGLAWLRKDANDFEPVLTVGVMSGGTAAGHDRRRRIHILGPGAEITVPWSAKSAFVNNRAYPSSFTYGTQINGSPYLGPALPGVATPYIQVVYNYAAGGSKVEACFDPSPNKSFYRNIVRSPSGKPNDFSAAVPDGGNYDQITYLSPIGGVLTTQWQEIVEADGAATTYQPLRRTIAGSSDGVTFSDLFVWYGGGHYGILKGDLYVRGSIALGGTSTQRKFFPTNSATVFFTSGVGTPEGVVTAGIGSIFTRTDGGAGTTLYVKQTGTGNTGWAAK